MFSLIAAFFCKYLICNVFVVEEIMFKKTLTQPFEDLSIHPRSTDSNIVWPSFDQDTVDGQLDHFIHTKGEIFAGRHLIIDLWGAQRLGDLDHMESALRLAIERSKATLLHIHLHHFTPNGGISGVAVLAESHISVHTWPEKKFAAFDVFMCGNAEPNQAIKVFNDFFEPEHSEVNTIKRGKVK